MKAILLALLQTAAPGGVVGLVPAQSGAAPRSGAKAILSVADRSDELGMQNQLRF